MKWLQRKFRNISQKYQNQKIFFRKKIEIWKEKGWLNSYEKGKDLIEAADKLSDELKKSLFFETQEKPDKKIIKSKVRQFRKIYKQLHESTKSAIRQWFEAIVIALTLALVLRHTIFSPYHVPTGSAEPSILVGDRIWGNKMAYYFNDIKRGDFVIFDDPRHIYDRSNILQYLWQRYIGFPIPLLGLKSGPINVVKRVVAIPGDTIQGKIEDGKTVVYLNGKKLDEPYVNPFPLVAIKRMIGFLPFENIGPLPIPYFLKRRVPDHVGTRGYLWYTYNPSKPYNQQPYYYMSEKSVIKNPRTDKPALLPPFAPIYNININNKQFDSIDTFGPITLPKDLYWVMGDSRQNSDDSRSWGLLDRKFIRGRASFVLFSIDSEEPFWLFDVINHPIAFWTKHLRWSRFFKGLGDSVKGVEKK
ncbi:MAG: signal peptidase I [bacterium]